jgi:GNAT superfamily N-acetyltransferase
VAGTSIVTIAEGGLSADERRRIGELLAGILDEGHRYRERGWRTLPPLFRSLAVTASGEVVGQVSGFGVQAWPAVRVIGLGDLAVDPSWRGRGLARALCSAVVCEAWERDADVLLAKTRPMRRVLADLGFQPVTGFAFYWEDAGACHRHPDWMAASRVTAPTATWLAHGDF